MGRFRRAALASLALGTVLAGAAAGPALADGVVVAGANADGDEGTYGYLGGVVKLGGSADENGFLARVWLEAFQFDYSTVVPVNTPATIDGDGVGAEVEIGYQWVHDRTRLSLYAGPKVRFVDLTPDDPGTDVDNENLGIKGQVELTHSFDDRWSAEAMGSYTLYLEDYWTRLRPGYRFGSGIRVGPEVSAFGGQQYDKQRVGLYVEGIGFGSVSLGLSGGVQFDSREDNEDLYVGAGVAFKF